MFEFIQSFAAYIIPFVILLSIVVFFHEFGHFLVARFCGVKVDTFSLGFGPELFARNDRYGTRWRVAAIPLGGYVKFHGDANGSSALALDTIQTAPAGERAVSFAAQPVVSRAAIVLAGPLANFILAIVVLAGSLSYYGHPVRGSQIGTVMVGSAAEEAGLKANDVVMSIDGKPTPNYAKVLEALARSTDEPFHLVVRRMDHELALTMKPDWREFQGPVGKLRLRFGLNASDAPSNIQHESYKPVESLGLATSLTWQMVSATGSYLIGLVAGHESADQLSGPIGIAQISHQSAQETLSVGLLPFLNLIAMFSVSVGLLNLLPVPLLDGGHLAYFAMEAVIGRPLDKRVQEFGLRMGLAMVCTLLVFSTYNDLARLIR